MSVRPRVVIVGAGFGGLTALRALAKAAVDVILVDKNNYHMFVPLLYQVAAAEISSEDIAFPVRRILWQRQGSRFVLADVERLDLGNRIVAGGEFQLEYDYLILATGSVPYFAGVPGAGQFSFPLKTMEDGIVLRNHLLDCFERAAAETDPEHRRRLLTFVIAGGGATGVEFAGALAELVARPLVNDYPQLDFSEVRIVLLEGRDRLLPTFPEKLSRFATDRLRNKGVEIRLGTYVESVQPQSLQLKDGTRMETETLVWVAGVQGAPAVRAWGLPTVKNGQVQLGRTLQVADHPEVYVVGDLARFEQNGQPLPMTAPVAIQQGEAAARNIIRQIEGKPPEPFVFRDPGMVLTVGRNSAVADVHGHAWTGFSAWLLWLIVHIYQLIGFRNRLAVMIDWAWSYLLYESAVRLILPTNFTASKRLEKAA